MVHLASLWLPILVSAVFVFLASTVIHMTPLWHRNDFAPLPREGEVLGALRPFGMPPGDYFVPRATDMKDMRTPAFQERLRQGPVLVMTVLPNGMVNMRRSLAQWFVFLVVVGIFAGYVACISLPLAAAYPRVFRLVFTAAFMAYVLALAELSIWYRRGWSLTLKAALDGVIYAALTAGTFGWLWPR